MNAVTMITIRKHVVHSHISAHVLFHADYDEYTVTLFDGAKAMTDTAYYTDDLDDAVGTAACMVKDYVARNSIEYRAVHGCDRQH